MADFFSQSFEAKVECIIGSGDLNLLQAFIGIRNPIGLLQYYSTFITTKINLVDTRLHGQYEVQKRWLIHYRDNVIREKNQSGTRSVADNKNSNFCSRYFSEVSTDVKNELFRNALISLTSGTNKSYDSICNSDYMYQSNSDQELLSYTRSTEINSLCSMDRKQVDEMYDNLVRKSKTFVKGVIKKHPDGSPEQKTEIDEELSVIRKNMSEQEREIVKYKNALRQVKDRSFLKEWDTELANRVKKDAKEKEDHILHKYLPKDQRREVAFIENLKNQFILEVVSRLLKEILKDRYNEQAFNYFKDMIMDQLDDSSKLHYQCFVDRTRARLMEEMDECNENLKETLELIIREIKADKVIRVEQSVLDDILIEAVSQGKQDCALLLICNGANINLEREREDGSNLKVRERLDKHTLDKSGFLVIRKLYSDMPSIKANLRIDLDIQTLDDVKGFVVEGTSRQKENYQEFMVNDILTLSEIRDIFPENTIVKEAADSLTKCDKDKLDIKETVVNKQNLLNELQEKLKCKKQEYTKPSWKWAAVIPLLAVPWYSLVYAAVYVGSCLIASVIDIGRPWKARRNAQNELQVAQEDLSRATDMFDIFLEYLQCSVVAGSDIFMERCKEIQEQINIIKKNKEKWVNLASILIAFENAQNVSGNKNSSFLTESVKFSKLAEDMICNRIRYMDELSRPDQPSKGPDQTVSVKDDENVGEDVKIKKAETKQERTVEEEQKGKIEFYESLLLQLQSGNLSLNEIQQMDLRSSDAASSD